MMAGELKWAMVFDGRKLPSYADDKEDDALSASGGSCEPKIREISVTGGWGERRRHWVGSIVDSQEERREEEAGWERGEHDLVGEVGGERGEEMGWVLSSATKKKEEKRLLDSRRGERREEKGSVVGNKEERGGYWIAEGEHTVAGEGGGDWGERRRDGDGFSRRGARCRPVAGEGGGERGEEMGMRMASAEGE